MILEGDNLSVSNDFHAKSSGGALVVDVFHLGLSCNNITFQFVKRGQFCGSLLG